MLQKNCKCLGFKLFSQNIRLKERIKTLCLKAFRTFQNKVLASISMSWHETPGKQIAHSNEKSTNEKWIQSFKVLCCISFRLHSLIIFHQYSLIIGNTSGMDPCFPICTKCLIQSAPLLMHKLLYFNKLQIRPYINSYIQESSWQNIWKLWLSKLCTIIAQ